MLDMLHYYGATYGSNSASESRGALADFKQYYM